MVKKPELIAGVLDVGTFNVQVGVFQSVKNCVKYLRNLGCDPVHDTRACYGQARWDEDKDGVLWWSIVIEDDATTATVVHECVHMADFIMDKLGIPTGVKNTEVRAYLTADIFRGVMQILGRAE